MTNDVGETIDLILRYDLEKEITRKTVIRC